jgi:hypothetical protein
MLHSNRFSGLWVTLEYQGTQYSDDPKAQRIFEHGMILSNNVTVLDRVSPGYDWHFTQSVEMLSM